MKPCVLVAEAGSQGGAALCRNFSGRGFSVVGVDRYIPAAAREAIDLPIEADLARFEEAAEAVGAALELFRRIDLLVFCPRGDGSDRIGAVCNLIAAAAPHFRRTRRGRIVVVGSSAATGLVRAFACELGPDNVEVVRVAAR
jgi:NAD(P)-dependent dehydrogenase (short-subunit alcohol dehydrogenase family)